MASTIEPKTPSPSSKGEPYTNRQLFRDLFDRFFGAVVPSSNEEPAADEPATEPPATDEPAPVVIETTGEVVNESEG